MRLVIALLAGGAVLCPLAAVAQKTGDIIPPGWQEQLGRSVYSQPRNTPSYAPRTAPQSLQRSAVSTGNVMVTEARIERDGTSFPWLRLEVQNTTNTVVGNVYVTWEVSNADRAIDSDVFLMTPSRIEIGQKGSVRIPINIGTGQELGNNPQIRIREISWVDSTGQQRSNTRWGRLLF